MRSDEAKLSREQLPSRILGAGDYGSHRRQISHLRGFQLDLRSFAVIDRLNP